MLVTERPGDSAFSTRTRNYRPPVEGAPARCRGRGQGGLLDIVLAPDFAQSRIVYFSFAERAGMPGRSIQTALRSPAPVFLKGGKAKLAE